MAADRPLLADGISHPLLADGTSYALMATVSGADVPDENPQHISFRESTSFIFRES